MQESIAVIRRRLDRGEYPTLGTGSGRIVYDLNNGYVAKVAKNEKGFAQNKVEYRIYMSSENPLLAEIVYCTSDYKIVIMRKAKKIADFDFILDYFEVDRIKDLAYVDEVYDLIENYNLIFADFEKTTSWGIIKNRPAIVDYGFTRQVRLKYYKKKRR
ncbi:MAG: hypothetical protein E7256_10830 [Lachnospiraceae bacterium]|nr:hypothetical protein [Lachnospiraceae bacterium]